MSRKRDSKTVDWDRIGREEAAARAAAEEEAGDATIVTAAQAKPKSRRWVWTTLLAFVGAYFLICWYLGVNPLAIFAGLSAIQG